MKVIGYARCSTTEQAISGLGIDDQRRAIRQECTHRGWDLVDVIVDEGETGKHLDRPGLQRALGMLAGRQVDGLVTKKLDRLSRSVIDFATLLDWFATARSTLVVLDPEINTATPNGRLVANVLISVAEWERDVIASRTSDALRAKRARGERIGPVAVTDQPDLAARIHQMRAEGSTYQAIADQLNAEGVPTLRGGREWRVSSVQAATGYRRPTSPHKKAELPTPRRRSGSRAS